MFRKMHVGTLVSFLCGFIVFVLGILAVCGALFGSHSYVTSSSYHASYTFGADFYTEMFGVTYEALQQLNEISRDLGTNLRRLTETMDKYFGVLLIAAGLLVMGSSAGKLLTMEVGDLPFMQKKTDDEPSYAEDDNAAGDHAPVMQEAPSLYANQELQNDASDPSALSRRSRRRNGYFPVDAEETGIVQGEE